MTKWPKVISMQSIYLLQFFFHQSYQLQHTIRPTMAYNDCIQGKGRCLVRPFLLVEERQFVDRNTAFIGMLVTVKRQQVLVDDHWTIVEELELSWQNESSFEVDIKRTHSLQSESLPITGSVELLKQFLQNFDCFQNRRSKTCNRECNRENVLEG